ncbi:DsbA family protein [Spiractinospora alimapuensis]|uniref:DsbA family protein n=1 Tax=Spiractinospora alimapuensis TaxID=2820884 RepID=UPI001F3FFAF5|nr:DsbA family protein [Spiractinospora alimapuensis]
MSFLPRAARGRWHRHLAWLALVALTASCAQDEGDTQTAPDEDTTTGVTAEMREAGEGLARRDPDDPMAIGDVDAPVVLIAYSDYQCPFCKRWVDDTQPTLIEEYADEGTLRIEWREFPYLGEDSQVLSLGAAAAAEQDKFWEYHHAVFADLEELGEAGGDLLDEIEHTADEAGLDGERLREDMADDALAAAVDEDLAEGQQLGISGTPAFLINGEPVMGAQPLEVFTASVDRALAEADR